MNAKPTLARPRLVTTIVATALSALIAIGLLSGVAALFQRDGAPFEQAVIAEHACANYAFVSEREACVRLFVLARVTNEPFAARQLSVSVRSIPVDSVLP